MLSTAVNKHGRPAATGLLRDFGLAGSSRALDALGRRAFVRALEELPT
jgi:hypothetical protein